MHWKLAYACVFYPFQGFQQNLMVSLKYFKSSERQRFNSHQLFKILAILDARVLQLLFFLHILIERENLYWKPPYA